MKMDTRRFRGMDTGKCGTENTWGDVCKWKTAKLTGEKVGKWKTAGNLERQWMTPRTFEADPVASRTTETLWRQVALNLEDIRDCAMDLKESGTGRGPTVGVTRDEDDTGEPYGGAILDQEKEMNPPMKRLMGGANKPRKSR